MSATNRRFGRRAKQLFNPPTRENPVTLCSTQPEPNSADDASTKTVRVSPSVLKDPSKRAVPSERQCPLRRRAVSEDAAGRAPNAERQSYVSKRRVGKKTISTYVGAKDSAADIAFIDTIFRQAAIHYRRIANELIVKLKLMHSENERAYAAAEAEMTVALTAAGYHRTDRGPWRKLRGNRSVLTPGIQPAPRNEYAAGRVAERLTPVLHTRFAFCRRHVYELEDLYQSTPLRARSKTAGRIYARYLKRASNRLAAAEKSLQTIHNLTMCQR